MSEQSIYMAFGPVQEFLAQARRTRDLWAGSYLLSYLAGHVLVAAEAQEGTRIVLPWISGNPLMEGIRNKRAARSPGDRVGSIPHVVELAAPRGMGRRVAETAVEAWRQEWQRVSRGVYDLVCGECPNWTKVTDEIWARQTDGLWTHIWVLDDSEGIARRKTLRSFYQDEEPGEKCTCCGVREALRGDDESRRGVRDFWRDFAARVDPHEIQMEGRERLCAVCTTKRFFPRFAVERLGWNAPSGYPSSTALASLPWRIKVIEAGRDHPDLRAAVALHCEALATAGIRPNAALASFPAFRGGADAWPESERGSANALLQYDGDWFYPEVVRDQERATNLGAERDNVIGGLDELRKSARVAGLSYPGTYYAMLAMDGDRLGKLLQSHHGQKQAISRALQDFSQEALEIVEGPVARGILVYGGGDDVLALLPVDTALRAAADLREAYRSALERHVPNADATISAGLVYAHMNAPLRQVVATVHRILEEKAKTEAGRDALAVAVWKRPGIVVEFARRWNQDAVEGVEIVEDLEKVRKGLEDGIYSRGFIYRLRDVVPASTTEWSTEAVEAVLTAEYLKSRERVVSRDVAEERVKVLRRLAWAGQNGDAALLAAFLAGEKER